MHEAGLMQNALEIAEERARLHGATRIRCITLRVGRMAGVEPEALTFVFDVMAAGTMAEGAALHIEAVPVVCYCDECKSDFTPEGFVFTCPGCGQVSREVREGQELELASLEVSDDEA